MSSVKNPTHGPLLALAYFGFISLGLPDGLIGVGWPSMSDDFRVPLDALGFVTIVGMVGYISSSVAAGFAMSGLGVGRLLAGSTALASVALVGFLGSPFLAVLVGFALLLGLGSGAIDSGLNAYAASAFGPRHMNWMHAFFGLGVAIGPLIMTAVLEGGLSWRWGYGIVAGFQALLALAFVLTANWWGRTPAAEAKARDATPADGERSRDTLALPAVWLGALAFALYVAVEVAAGLWGYVLLTRGRGMAPSIAGICISIYWGSLFVGRLVLGVVSERFSAPRMLYGALSGVVLGTLLIALPAPGWVAAVGLAILGFAAAPVFPLLTLTTADRVGAAHADRAIGIQVGSAGVGGVLLPAGIGVLLNRIDVELLGPSLLALAVLLLILYALSPRHRGSVSDSSVSDSSVSDSSGPESSAPDSSVRDADVIGPPG